MTAMDVGTGSMRCYTPVRQTVTKQKDAVARYGSARV